ncbi:hypothetical protein I3842_16G069200 [Carya illinoinensis]|uniref:Uncharacterized protein n=2 Tax=Carya illinoinensis TaxID=32201 RepID=A0A922A7S3_CARIL|nr:hypothetical protein I3842_16G069200 [Carya illinoinensis]
MLLFVFLFAITTKPFPGATEAMPAPVLNKSKNKLIAGVDYHILPVTHGTGKGLSLSISRNKSCPLDVVQDEYEGFHGLPPTVWKLDSFDYLTKQWFVMSNGVEGNSGREMTSNSFKIKKYYDDYKFLFYPMVCSSCKALCKDIGIYIVYGKMNLALSDVLLKVMFKKSP